MVFLEECLIRVSGVIPRKKPQQVIPSNDSKRNLQIELLGWNLQMEFMSA